MYFEGPVGCPHGDAGWTVGYVSPDFRGGVQAEAKNELCTRRGKGGQSSALAGVIPGPT